MLLHHPFSLLLQLPHVSLELVITLKLFSTFRADFLTSSLMFSEFSKDFKRLITPHTRTLQSYVPNSVNIMNMISQVKRVPEGNQNYADKE